MNRVEEDCHIAPWHISLICAFINAALFIIGFQLVGPWIFNTSPLDDGSAAGLFIGCLYGSIWMRSFISR